LFFAACADVPLPVADASLPVADAPLPAADAPLPVAGVRQVLASRSSGRGCAV